jgi:CDP-diacylglycerol---glycerol-3-phosphate 3-phosphatidyltransferase
MVLPNQLTVLRIILTPVFLFLFLSGEPMLIQFSLGVFIIAALTDWYDGWLARKFNYITEWGKFWDPMADKILTSTAFIGFVILGVLEWWMVSLIVARDIIITLLRLYAENRGKNFITSYYAKWKTLLQMIFLYYLLIIYTAINTESIYSGNENIFSILWNETLIYIAMLTITVITVHSGYTYLYSNKKLIADLFSETNKLV